MSRISYSDEEDYPGQFDLWQANCDRSIEGKKGQAALRELEQALLELPEKKLIGHKLQDEGGGVCAIGAVVKHRGASVKTTPEDVEEVGIELGFPRMVAWKVVCLNDIEVDGRYEQQLDGRHKFIEVTDEERYCQVLSQVQKWIKRNLKKQQCKHAMMPFSSS